MNNSDHVFSLSHQSRSALAVQVGQDLSDAQTFARKAAEFEIAAVNKLRAAGIHLQEACNHQQINFKFFEKFKAEYPNQLDGLTFDQAKVCIRVARKLKNEVGSLNDIRRFKQTAFECFSLATPAQREIVQHAREINHRSEIVRLVAALEKAIKALRADEGEGCVRWLQVQLFPLEKLQQ